MYARVRLTCLVLALGCSGSIGPTPAVPEDVPVVPPMMTPAAQVPPPTMAPMPVVTTRLARLSHRQYENAVRDLLFLPARPGLAARFRGDAALGKFDNNGGSLSVDENLRRDYREAAERLAEQVTHDPAALAKVAPAGTADRARAFVEGFGRRVYRRPLTAAEVNRYLVLINKGREVFAGVDPFADGVRLALEAFLQSPHFLYRTELGGGGPLDQWERATKLSFALVHSTPDDQLLAAAAANQLGAADVLRRHAERLLASPGAREVFDDFHGQLLRLQPYDDIEKDTKVFPQWMSGMGADMRRETLMFTRDVVEKNGGFRDLLQSPQTFVSAKLAPLYGVPSPAGGFAPAALDPAQRAGVLTQLGFLASNAYAKDVDSIHRGVFVHHNVLCTDLPPPVDGVSLSGAKGRTNRERITSITGDGTCGAGCHSKMINPVGFAFEHYDAIGRYRTEDNGAPVDASGRFAFDGVEKPFKDAVEFSRLVADSRAAHACYARHLLEYLHGRVPESADEARVTALRTRSLQERASVKALMLDLVTSEDFLSRLP